MELDFSSFQIKIALNLKSQLTAKLELICQGPNDCENLQTVVDYKYVKISKVLVMDIKLWMKKDLDLHTDRL